MAGKLSDALRQEILGKLAAHVPYRTLAEEYGLSRGTIYGLAKGQHGVKSATAEKALSQGGMDYTMPLMVKGNDLQYLTSYGDDGLPRFHPARKSDSSLIGRWWNDYKTVRQSKFQDFSALEKYRGKTVRVLTTNGVQKVQLLSDRDADAIKSWVNLPSQGDPREVVRYERGRGRKKVA